MVLINWGVSSFYGWGVYGLNLALNWARDPEIKPVGTREIPANSLALDPLSRLVLQPFLNDTAEMAKSLDGHAGEIASSSGPVLLALDDFGATPPGANGVTIRGRPNIGVSFFARAGLPPEAVARLQALDIVVAGCRWNEELIRAHGIDKVATIIQGIDPTLFHPAPRRGLVTDRFLVFSGGKLERRKGQDLVLAAFRIFAERRPDALLVTAWHSPWPEVARTLDEGGAAAAVPFHPSGAVDVKAWAVASGVPARQVLDLGVVPNAALPPLLREMDVALFPNRCEGGTNLVAMECMACGVPAILSANTGHLDLIEDDNCYPLVRQAALPGEQEGPFGGVLGWGESDLDEIVAALEAAYADRETARRRGLKGAETLSRFTWARTAAEMKGLILSMT